MNLSRRRFFTRSGAVAAGVAAAPAFLAGPARAASRPGQRPGRIILVVSDGMSLGTLSCADHFSVATRGRALEWTALAGDSRAHQGLMHTRSLNSLVTDSAAAASSWGTGVRVKNGAVNVLPDGRELVPLCPLFRAQGWATALVTTTELTHATPAGFAAAVPARSQGERIAEQYLERDVDLLLGGGRDHFDPAKRADRRDLFAAFRTAGHPVWRTRDELLAAAPGRRGLGLFAAGHLPYTLEQAGDERLRRAVPTLAEMTRWALRGLAGTDRFLLQVEGGRVDHAAHNSDAAAAIHDQLALDDALAEALAFQRAQPDTLVVVTTDHGNSNLGLNGMGGSYGGSSRHFAHLAAVRRSLPVMLAELQRRAGGRPDGQRTLPDGSKADIWRVDPRDILEVVGEGTGWKLPPARAEHFARVLAGAEDPLYDQMHPPITQFGQLLANHLGIGWTGNSHTSDFAPVVAIGPGAQRFRGVLENTDLFVHFTALAGIDHRNPAVPLLAESSPSAAEAEQWG